MGPSAVPRNLAAGVDLTVETRETGTTEIGRDAEITTTVATGAVGVVVSKIPVEILAVVVGPTEVTIAPGEVKINKITSEINKSKLLEMHNQHSSTKIKITDMLVIRGMLTHST